MSMGDKAAGVFGCLFMILILVYGIAQLWAGYIGIEYHLGKGWAIAAFILAFFRLSLPITIGSFFGAMNVWGWHWALAFAFAAPGIALFIIMMIPGMISSVFEKFRK